MLRIICAIVSLGPANIPIIFYLKHTTTKYLQKNLKIDRLIWGFATILLLHMVQILQVALVKILIRFLPTIGSRTRPERPAAVILLPPSLTSSWCPWSNIYRKYSAQKETRHNSDTKLVLIVPAEIQGRRPLSPITPSYQSCQEKWKKIVLFLQILYSNPFPLYSHTNPSSQGLFIMKPSHSSLRPACDARQKK